MSNEPLAQVWNLVERHRASHQLAASDAEVIALRAEQAAITDDVVPDAIEAFVDRHRGALTMTTRPAPDALARLESELGPVHPLHRRIVQRYGALEIRIAGSHWPGLRHMDGLRVLGWAPDEPWLHLPTMRRYHLDRCRERRESGMADDARLADAHEPLLPFLTTLEGLRHQWLADTNTVELALYGALDHRNPALGGDSANPRFGPAYALLARLHELEQRLAAIAGLRGLAGLCDEAVEFDHLEQIVVVREPSIVITRGKFDQYRPAIVRRLHVGRPSQDNPLYSHPTLEARAAALDARVVGARVVYSDADISAEIDLPTRDLTAAHLRFAIARLDHIGRMHADEAEPDFDEVPAAIPDGVQGILAQLGADHDGFSARFAHCLPPPRHRRVELVGQRFPRIRWSYSTEAVRRRDAWTSRSVGDRLYCCAELLVELVDEARVHAIMDTIPIEPPRKTWSSEYSEAENRQMTCAVAAISRETLRYFDSVDEPDPTSARWRAMAEAQRVTTTELDSRLRYHEQWLNAHRGDEHRFLAFSHLDITFAVYRGDDSTLRLDLSRRDLRDLDFRDRDLTAAALPHVIVSGVGFENASLRAVYMTDSEGLRARFDGADLRGIDLSRSDLRGASFRNANCEGADFERCDLTDCDFTGARLAGVKTKGAVGFDGPRERG